jgi:hypothetical protein
MNTIIKICVLIILTASNCFSQNYVLIEIKNSIKFGNNFGDLGKNLQFNNGTPLNYGPDDIEVDINNNFYICDRFSKRILKLDENLNTLFEITIYDEHFVGRKVIHNKKEVPEELSYKIDLETDYEGNLYVLIGYSNSFYNLIKYDKDGNQIENFKLEQPFPHKMWGGLKVGSNKIFVITSPHSPVNLGYINEGRVFAYSLEGKYLGRCDYYTEDQKGNIYKQNTLNKRNLIWIDEYAPNNSSIVQTSSLNLETSLNSELPENVSLGYIGIDRSYNLYFVSGSPFIITIFNFSNKFVQNISFNRQEIDNYLANNYKIVLSHNPFILSPNGQIYLYGFKVNKENPSTETKCNYQEIELSFVKLQFK